MNQGFREGLMVMIDKFQGIKVNNRNQGCEIFRLIKVLEFLVIKISVILGI
jgi:hypothetical protein